CLSTQNGVRWCGMGRRKPASYGSKVKGRLRGARTPKPAGVPRWTRQRQTPDIGEMRKTPSASRGPTVRSHIETSSRLATAWLEPSDAGQEAPLTAVGGACSAYQAAWLARAIATSRPARHVD